MNIRRTDLNLLAVFEVLMQERNVTRAAARLGLSQPAVSAALGRLRDSLGDRLLVRSGPGMRPTPRAEQLVGSISQALDSIESALALGATFVPAVASRSFTLMLSDIGEIIYLPRLIERVQREAPSIQLSIRRLARARMADELAVGALTSRSAGSIVSRMTSTSIASSTRPLSAFRSNTRASENLSLAQFASNGILSRAL